MSEPSPVDIAPSHCDEFRPHARHQWMYRGELRECDGSELSPAASAGEHCFFHGYEPTLPGDYKACGECWHVWRTEAEFAADVAQVYRELARAGYPQGEIPALDQISACPLCTHDL